MFGARFMRCITEVVSSMLSFLTALITFRKRMLATGTATEPADHGVLGCLLQPAPREFLKIPLMQRMQLVRVALSFNDIGYVAYRLMVIEQLDDSIRGINHLDDEMSSFAGLTILRVFELTAQQGCALTLSDLQLLDRASGTELTPADPGYWRLIAIMSHHQLSPETVLGDVEQQLANDPNFSLICLYYEAFLREYAKACNDAGVQEPSTASDFMQTLFALKDIATRYQPLPAFPYPLPPHTTSV